MEYFSYGRKFNNMNTKLKYSGNSRFNKKFKPYVGFNTSVARRVRFTYRQICKLFGLKLITDKDKFCRGGKTGIWPKDKVACYIGNVITGYINGMFRLWIQDSSILAGINDRIPIEAGETVFNRLVAAGIHGTPPDSKHRQLGILQFFNNEVKLPAGCMVGNRNVSGMTFSELPPEMQEWWLNLDTDVTVFYGTRDDAERYYHYDNAGVPQSSGERFHVLDTIMANWIKREVTGVNFRTFKINPVTGKSPFLNYSNKRMVLDNMLCQLAVYCGVVNGNIIDISVLKSVDLVKFVKQGWTDLHAIPSMDGSNVYDLQGDVSGIMGWVDEVLIHGLPDYVRNVTIGQFIHLGVLIDHYRKQARMQNKTAFLQNSELFAENFWNAWSVVKSKHDADMRMGKSIDNLDRNLGYLLKELNGMDMGIVNK